MKISVELGALRDAVARAAGAVSNNNVKPILACLRLSADQNCKLTVSGTNLDHHVSASIIAKDVTPGSCLLRAEKLRSILQSCTAETVEIIAEEGNARITSGRAKWSLQTESVSDWPATPMHKGVEAEVDIANWRYCATCALAVADRVDGSRYALASLLHQLADGRMVIAGTDGHAVMATGFACDGAATGLMPREAAMVALKSLPATGPATMTISESRITIEHGDVAVSVRCAEGRFPNWRQVVDDLVKRAQTWFTCESEPLLAALRQVAVTTSAESKGVDLLLSAGAAVISSQAVEVGKTEVDLPLAYSGDDASVRFDPTFFTPSLKAADRPQVELALFGGDKTADGLLMRADGLEYVLMGMSTDK